MFSVRGKLMVRIRYVMRRLLKRLYSRQAWVVLQRKLHSPIGRHAPPESLQFGEVTQSELSDLAHSLPFELAGDLTEQQRLSLVKDRYRAGIPCFVVKDKASEAIAAGCWAKPLDDLSPLYRVVEPGCNAFEISRLFVSPDFRGKRLAVSILEEACSQMFQKGYSRAVSLIWYSRIPSIKAHLASGFEPVGQKVTWSLLGFRWTTYRKYGPEHLSAKLNRVLVK